MKKILIPLFCLGVSVMLLAACGASTEPQKKSNDNPEPSAYHKITAQEAKSMMDELEDEVLVDVRTQEEYNKAHIENAVLIPNETIGDEMPEELPDQDQAIFVYCRSGVRSRQASEQLVKLGYTKVYDMGGIQDWPYDTVSE